MTMSNYNSKLWDLAKAVIIGIFMRLNTFIKKCKTLPISDKKKNNLSLSKKVFFKVKWETNNLENY